MTADGTYPTFPDLAGKVAVVTGGSGGIGAATCRLLAANGARVVVNGRDQTRIARVVEAITATGGTAVGVAADCTEPDGAEMLREQAQRELGPVDVVAAFVGTGRAMPGPVAQTPVADWHSSVDGSLTATFLTLRSFLPGMTERGRGAVVTMSSSAARVPTPANAAYASAKAGVIMLTRQVASEVGRNGVRVNCVVPHTVLTDAIARYMTPERQREAAATIPLGRLGQPDDVALATVFLLSESAGWITGVALDVAGGFVMP